MNKQIPMAGLRFGRLLVVGHAAASASWHCQCDCGGTIDALGSNLRSGATSSCGCLKRETDIRKLRAHPCLGTHRATVGKRPTREYVAWGEVKRRCFNTKSKSYKDYGGRGITMCDAWVQSFPAFRDAMGPCPEGYELDRIDANGHYEPGNCRWATRKQQMNNTRRTRHFAYEGQDYTLPELAERLGIKYSALYRRLLLGESVEEAAAQIRFHVEQRKRA